MPFLSVTDECLTSFTTVVVPELDESVWSFVNNGLGLSTISIESEDRSLKGLYLFTIEAVAGNKIESSRQI